MEKRLIPYSVYLREDVYLKLRKIAKSRKAAALVRNAVTMVIEGDDLFNAGYNKALRDIITAVHDDPLLNTIGVRNDPICVYLDRLITPMIINQHPNRNADEN